MYSPPDDIDLWIRDLKNIRLTLVNHKVQQVQDSVPHLEEAIRILTEYKNSRNQQEFEPEPRPEKPKAKKEIVQKKNKPSPNGH